MSCQYGSENALFWSRMAGRITNFSFLGGYPSFYLVGLFRKADNEKHPRYSSGLDGSAQTCLRGVLAGGNFLISSCFRGTRPGGIAGKIPPAPLTIGGCPIPNSGRDGSGPQLGGA